MWRRLVFAGLFAATSVYGQQPKNVKVLVGLSRPEVQRVMNEMRAGLGVHCHYCHVAGRDPSFDGTPQKARALEMMRMVIDLNQRYFGGRVVVTCFTCHNGTPHPKLSPPLPQALPLDLPANPPVAETKKPPTPAEVLQRYVTAVGRIVPASEPRRIVATHLSQLGGPVAVQLLESGDRMRTDIALPDGTVLTRVVTGSGGWIRDKSGVHEMQLEELAESRLSRRPYALFSESSFEDDATVIADKIGEKDVWVVVTPSARYSFDAQSGLLLRRVIFYDSPIGQIPEQTEFDHYRDVGGGVKLPFTTRVALVDPWLGGNRHATTIMVGKPISPEEFAKPSPNAGSGR